MSLLIAITNIEPEKAISGYRNMDLYEIIIKPPTINGMDTSLTTIKMIQAAM